MLTPGENIKFFGRDMRKSGGIGLEILLDD
jgi:hypothetical protein